MKKMLLAAMALGLTLPVTGTALAQTTQDLVGTWVSVSNISVEPDGSHANIFGPHGTGMAIFESSGHFALVNINPDTPKFAANSRARGTADENKAAVLGSIGLYGTYSVSDKVLHLKIEGSTYPNWTGTDQTRNIVSYSTDDFKWGVHTSIGGIGEVTWKRLK